MIHNVVNFLWCLFSVCMCACVCIHVMVCMWWLEEIFWEPVLFFHWIDPRNQAQTLSLALLSHPLKLIVKNTETLFLNCSVTFSQ